MKKWMAGNWMSDMGEYRCILADPPWPYASPRAVVGNAGRGSQNGTAAKIIQADVLQHYNVLSIKEIESLPIKLLADNNAHLYLWTTNSFMVEAHCVAVAWGFVPKTIITWGKIRKADKTSFEPSQKTGYWFRSATEHCLFAVRGRLRLKVNDAQPTLFLHERLPHSVKPQSFISNIEMWSPGPYLELFARQKRNGWDAWGNEVDSIKMP